MPPNNLTEAFGRSLKGMIVYCEAMTDYLKGCLEGHVDLAQNPEQLKKLSERVLVLGKSQIGFSSDIANHAKKLKRSQKA
jgi:hypothetical protein